MHVSVLKRGFVQLGRSLIKFSNVFAGPILPYSVEDSFSYGEGATLVKDMIHYHPDKITKIYVIDTGMDERFHDEALADAERLGIPIERTKSSRGVRGRWNWSLVAQFEKWDDALVPGSHLVLVNLTGKRNIGAIVRTALGFGIQNIAVIADRFDTFDPTLIRMSMGTRLGVHMEVFPTFEAYRERFPENNLYAFMLDGAARMRNVEKKAPYSLIFGNETMGLPPEFATFCQPVFIEQSSDLDSLNVGVAAGVACYLFSQDATS